MDTNGTQRQCVYIYYTYRRHEDNAMRPSSPLPQWLFRNMLAMEVRWGGEKGVLALLVLVTGRPQPTCCHKAIVAMRRMGVLDCLHGATIYIYININTYTYMYYALCFVYIEHSVCHEPISVLINIFMLLQSVS